MKFCYFALLSLAMSILSPSPLKGAALSHPPLRVPVFNDALPLPDGPRYHVDPQKGDDRHPGSLEKPWKTVQASLEKLRPGDTLLLRGGLYHERIYCSITGTPDAPITIRSYPGEQAILDGGIPEFALDPASAWKPGEAEGEYVSTRSYPNLRDLLGLFGDSNIGLQTYWHRDYLLTKNELIAPPDARGEPVPYYCGPGLYYHKATGRIHVRLAPTHLPSPWVRNYRGERDPRKLPLVIAPFRSIALHLDQAMHLRIQNLVIRGGGYRTVRMSFAVDVEFDYVTVYGGSYCISAKNSGPVKLSNCGIYGQIPPWGYRNENSLGTYDPVYYDPYTQPPTPRPNRNVARLPTHAVLVTEGAEEHDIFAYPYNNRWEISQCEFADAHDGVYLSGQQMWMHHSWIYNMQDDAIYLSSSTPQGISDDVHISENFVARCIIPFGAHTRGAVGGDILVYGNIVDMRYPANHHRPSMEHPEEEDTFPNTRGAFFLVHGRKELVGMENIGFFHNTVISTPRPYAGAATGRTFPKSTRSVYNNLFVYYQGLPPQGPKPAAGPLQINGNLHWSVSKGEEAGREWILADVRGSEGSRANVEQWKGTPWEVDSFYADPELVQLDVFEWNGADYRLQPGSPARNRAVTFPQQERLKWPAPARHIGAIQSEEVLRVGINRRLVAGETEQPAPAK